MAERYVVLTENDVSTWEDETGAIYHYPSRYSKYLQEGVAFIYYKGKIRDKSFVSKRLSNEPHYFGCGVLGKSYEDKASKKGDQFVAIASYTPFEQPVLAKTPDGYLEEIPASRQSNYWRDGVRPIAANVYQEIINKAPIKQLAEITETRSPLNDLEGSLESATEGNPTLKYVTTYERKNSLRRQAVAIHGDSCLACGFNFSHFYGEYARGYIQIHHVNPVSSFKEARIVDPENELVPLCANCHAVVHRRKEKTLSISELIALIKDSTTDA